MPLVFHCVLKQIRCLGFRFRSILPQEVVQLHVFLVPSTVEQVGAFFLSFLLVCAAQRVFLVPFSKSFAQHHIFLAPFANSFAQHPVFLVTSACHQVFLLHLVFLVPIFGQHVAHVGEHRVFLNPSATHLFGSFVEAFSRSPLFLFFPFSFGLPVLFGLFGLLIFALEFVEHRALVVPSAKLLCQQVATRPPRRQKADPGVEGGRLHLQKGRFLRGVCSACVCLQHLHVRVNVIDGVPVKVLDLLPEVRVEDLWQAFTVAFLHQGRGMSLLAMGQLQQLC
mmetsp:Transcript_56278/g.131968  ORF Transcript_56278/g.131968 Transcript_56278/m.131968 type:complete len:280 (-) Transcript_56278:32-871(-)